MEIKAVDPDFVRVWSRVAPSPQTPETPPPDLAAFVAGKLRAELERGRNYRRLGLAVPGRLAARRIELLRRGLFFLTGEQALPDLGEPSPITDRAALLRALYRAEELSERDYRQWAAKAEDPILVRVFHTCADACAQTRQLLWQSLRLP